MYIPNPCQYGSVLGSSARWMLTLCFLITALFGAPRPSVAADATCCMPYGYAAIFVWRYFDHGVCLCFDELGLPTTTSPSVDIWVRYGLYVDLYDCGHGEVECRDWTPPGAAQTLDCGERSDLITPFSQDIYGQGNEICDVCPGVATGNCYFLPPSTCEAKRVDTCTCDGEDCWMEVEYVDNCGEVVEGPPDP